MNTIVFYIMSFLLVLGFSRYVFELDGLMTYRVVVGSVFLSIFLYSIAAAYTSWKGVKTDRTRVIGTGETITVPVRNIE